MEVFGDFLWRRGLTFSTHTGKVEYLKTAINNQYLRFARDVRALDFRPYDLVITDFEPVSAWAAKLRNVKTIGIGHQYAFSFPIPRTGDDFIARRLMQYFAPANLGLGLHWHHFDQPILPPIIETPPEPERVHENKILVYLPFEDISAIVNLLARFDAFQFYVYSSEPAADKPSHIHVRPLSRSGFHGDLRDCSGVICNAGFELASEALQLGKKLLVKPLHSQMEQMSNALALEQLHFASVMPDLDQSSVAFWLKYGQPQRVKFPNVAEAVVEWIMAGEWRIEKDWIASIWSQVTYGTDPQSPSPPAEGIGSSAPIYPSMPSA
jgi:uncharacterized protein (TIGR00661 family)